MHGVELKCYIFSSGAYFYSMFEINFRFEGIFSREEVGPSKDIFPAMKSSKDWSYMSKPLILQNHTSMRGATWFQDLFQI